MVQDRLILMEVSENASMEFVRNMIRDYPFLRDVKVSGKGRNKTVIIKEINEKIRNNNLMMDVELLKNKVNGLIAWKCIIQAKLQELESRQRPMILIIIGALAILGLIIMFGEGTVGSYLPASLALCAFIGWLFFEMDRQAKIFMDECETFVRH